MTGLGLEELVELRLAGGGVGSWWGGRAAEGVNRGRVAGARRQEAGRAAGRQGGPQANYGLALLPSPLGRPFAPSRPHSTLAPPDL